jgi:hypothetical protein
LKKETIQMIRNKNRRRYRIDQIDDPKVLKDGESLRVPMMFMDTASTRSRSSFKPSPSRVVDASGDPLGLHRPGFRIETGGDLFHQVVLDMKCDDRREAYSEYEAELRDAWITPAKTGEGSHGYGVEADEGEDEITSAGSREFIGQQLGDLCTCRGPDDEGDAGAAGTLQQRGGKLVCVASSARTDDRRQVQSRHSKQMDTLYEQRDRELRDEWRRG